ncbi:hypothetical protein [Xanthocytophaga agilis]|uniref:Uncharacterized protein n=1 Tax=Xanthocytophaga agilis TaxID=3048010 RepID=A0AAE3R296_9BACT|nr:hypothetical protein [Xanthocytophaga agilis]MDJ1500004.1 hypothetical protein [Xanthocytophaga agilis]
MELVGLLCEDVLTLPAKPVRKLEFIGNSITCGTVSDVSEILCDKNQWYDLHNAYMAYGPRTASELNAQWHLTSVSGIGLIHSCCNMDIVMPQVFDKVNQRANAGILKTIRQMQLLFVWVKMMVFRIRPPFAVLM